MICILVSLKEEAEFFLDTLNSVKKEKLQKFVIYRGMLYDREVQLLRTGIGDQPLIESMFDHCSFIISTGFCGALLIDIKAGDVIIAAEIVFLDTLNLDTIIKRKNKPDRAIESSFLKIPQAEFVYGNLKNLIKDDYPRLFYGRTVTASRNLKDYREKVAVNNSLQALSVDMEDFYRLRFIKSLGIPSISIRAALDEIHDEITSFKNCLHEPFLLKLRKAKISIAAVLEGIIREGYK